MAIGVGKLLTIAEHAQHIRMAANAGGDGAGSEAGHGAPRVASPGKPGDDA